MNKIQEEILKTYKEVKRVCERNNIRYFAIGGTAIGAVRHKGFIPWDDDIDLGIPIEDFDKFKSACKKDLKKPYKFTELNFIGGKVHNTNTTFLEAQCISQLDHYYGAFVDIFPLIGTPNDPTERTIFLKDMQRYYNEAFIFDRYPEASNLTRTKIIKLKNHICRSNALNSSKRIAEFASGYHFTKNPKGLLSPIIVKFEDTTIPLTQTFDEDLKNQYGDYMVLPPKNERYTHSKYSLIDLKKPYEYYYRQLSTLDPNLLALIKAKHNHEGIFYRDFLLKSEVCENLQSNTNQLNAEIQHLEEELDSIQQTKYFQTYRKISNIKSRLFSKLDRH